MLTLEAPEDDSAVDAFDEFPGLAFIGGGIPAAALEESAPASECRAPIGNRIPVNGGSVDAVQKDGGVAAYTVARIFGVPVRRPHRQNAQRVHFVRAAERVVDPTPVVLFGVALPLLIAQFEACVAESAVFADVGFGPLQSMRAHDRSVLDKVRGFRIEACRVEQARHE